MNVPTTGHRQPRRVATLAAVVALFAACGSATEGSDPTPGAEPAAPAATASPATATALTTAVAPTTTSAPTTTAAPTTTTTTQPPCEIKCPIDDVDFQLIEASVDAYNSGDWEAWLATIADDQPTFATPVGPQSTALVEYDFIWSAAMNDVWALGECLKIHSDIHCEVTIEDDLHRGLAALGLEPSECTIIVDVENGLVDWKKYVLYPCHSKYDDAMHTFGGWIHVNYPGLEPIDGIHYRGWNQNDTTAGQRAQEHLQIWLDSGDAWLGHPIH